MRRIRYDTFEADQPINLANMQSIVGSEKLKLLHRSAILGLERGRGHHKRNIVPRIRVHNLVCAKRPINPLDLVPRMLNHNRSRFRSLAIPHLRF